MCRISQKALPNHILGEGGEEKREGKKRRKKKEKKKEKKKREKKRRKEKEKKKVTQAQYSTAKRKPLSLAKLWLSIYP